MTLQARLIHCERSGNTLFQDISFDVLPGDAMHVEGRNGDGKTSLLRILCGLLSPTGGTVQWNGANIRSAREEYWQHLLYIAHANGLKEDLSAEENLVIAGRLSGIAIDADGATALLETLGLEECIGKAVGKLSQGQRRRIALARLWLAQDRPLWILDEPIAALDADAIRMVTARLNAHLASGGMVVYTTHQEWLLQPQRRLQLHLGRPSTC